MVKINWPSVQELLANPSKYGSYFTTPGADGYSIYSRLKESYNMYGLGEAQRNYEYAKADINRLVERAQNEVYNAMNKGTALDPNDPTTQGAKYYLDAAQKLISTLSPSIVSSPLPSYEQMTGQPMKDPQGTQVVGAQGNVVTPSTGFPEKTDFMYEFAKNFDPNDPNRKTFNNMPVERGLNDTFTLEGKTYKTFNNMPVYGSKDQAGPGTYLLSGQTGATQPGLITIQDETGNQMTVTQKNWDDVYSKQGGRYQIIEGMTQLPTGSSGTQPSADSGSTGSTIDDFAPDPSWAPHEQEAWNAFVKWIKDKEAVGQAINPDLNVEELMPKFLEQAKTELDPYYKQIIEQTQKDIQTGLKRLSEDVVGSERKLGEQYGKALESTQESYARRGLLSSSMRGEAEKGLAESAKRSLEDIQTETMRKAEDLGTKGERYLGSSFMPSEFPAMSASTRPIVGQPGQYGFQYGTPTRSLYAPQGGVRGTLEQEQEEKRRARISELATERARLLSSKLY